LPKENEPKERAAVHLACLRQTLLRCANLPGNYNSLRSDSINSFFGRFCAARLREMANNEQIKNISLNKIKLYYFVSNKNQMTGEARLL